MLVAYAGKDISEVPIYQYDAEERRKRTFKRPEKAYDLFGLGFSTFDMAKRFRVKEATILRWITEERSKRHGLSNPYEGRQ